MKRYFDKNKLVAVIAISAAFALPSLAAAKVSGPCGNCHTMHNSQDGTAMASTGAFGATIVADTSANGALLRYGCVGCHTGNNAGGTVPFVLGAAAPTYGVAGTAGVNTLAGGNFYWVNAGDDASGHNVIGLPAANLETVNTTIVPGSAGGTNVPGLQALTCASVTGCHGKRGVTDTDEFGSIAGGHHGAGSGNANGYVSGSTTDMSDAFRMLAGVNGIEDPNWEYTVNVGTGDHNVYSGVARASDATNTTTTISSLCAQCHGEFHNGAGNVSTTFGSPWVRHPTDFDMGDLALTSEYAGYATYNLEAPVASANLSAATVVSTTVFAGGLGTGTGNAIVTCVSCHRAHGSPNADLLRWNYAGMDAHSGANTSGCFACHTTKDDV